MSLFDSPKSRRVWLPVERITRDPALQMRVFPNGETTDPETVARYAELIEDGADFDDLEVVSTHDDPTDAKATNWLVAGWHRLAAREKNGQNSVACRVTKGTHRDAVFAACGQNVKGQLTRSPADARRQLAVLVGSPDLLPRVLTGNRGEGGTTVALARFVGMSKGFVSNTLAELGLRVDREGRIVRRPQPAAAKATPSQTQDGGEDTPEKEDTEPADEPGDTQTDTISPTVGEVASGRTSEESDDPMGCAEDLHRALSRAREAASWLLNGSGGDAARQVARACGLDWVRDDGEVSRVRLHGVVPLTRPRYSCDPLESLLQFVGSLKLELTQPREKV